MYIPGFFPKIFSDNPCSAPRPEINIGGSIHISIHTCGVCVEHKKPPPPPPKPQPCPPESTTPKIETTTVPKKVEPTDPPVPPCGPCVPGLSKSSDYEDFDDNGPEAAVENTVETRVSSNQICFQLDKLPLLRTTIAQSIRYCATHVAIVEVFL